MMLDFRSLTTGQGGRSAVARRQRAVQAKARLAGLAAARPDLAEAIDRRLAALAAAPGRLHAVLERQHYRVSYWRVAADEINYRRFFDRTGVVVRSRL